VEAVDKLKTTLMQPPPKENQVIMTTQWETFDVSMGSLVIPPPSSTSMKANWETFE
jgi:hypothetical protein